MLFFKSADKKFEDIGFKKISENKYGAEYERYNGQFKFTQSLCLMHKSSGHHIVQSYDKELFDEKMIGNCVVGLTMYEMELCLKKMREMGWKKVK